MMMATSNNQAMAGETAQGVKALAAMTKDLNSILRIHNVEGED